MSIRTYRRHLDPDAVARAKRNQEKDRELREGLYVRLAARGIVEFTSKTRDSVRRLVKRLNQSTPEAT